MFADATMGLGIFVSGLVRNIFMAVGTFNMPVSRLYCWTMPWSPLLLFGDSVIVHCIFHRRTFEFQVGAGMLFLLSLDRVVLVTVPTYYLSNNHITKVGTLFVYLHGCAVLVYVTFEILIMVREGFCLKEAQ